MERVRLGTTTGCEFRLNPESFFTDIELELEKSKNAWGISCSDELYISKGDMRKLLSAELNHGDVLSVRYTASGDEAFELRYMIDFEAEIPDYNWKISLQNINVLSIGDNPASDIIIKKKIENDSRLLLSNVNGQIWIEENSSQYGVYLNGKRITGKEQLHDCDFFSIGGTTFYYKKQELYFDQKYAQAADLEVCAIEPRKNSFHYPLFNRNTRIKEKLPQEKITVLDPPEAPVKPQDNIIMNLLPAIAMLIITVVVRGFMSSTSSTFVIFSVCSMGMGILTTIFGFVNGKRKYVKDCQKRVDDYGRYIEQKKEQISTMRQKELSILNNTYYDPARELQVVNDFEMQLFDREPEDEDFLCCYLGSGKVKSRQEIDFKKQEKFETSDELAKIPEQIHDMFQYIDHAPVTVNIKDANAVGVIGTSETNDAFFRNMVLDIAIRHYYENVRMYALIDQNEKKYAWLKLLPHFQNEEKDRNIVYDVESKNNVFENLYKELSRREENDIKKEHIVIFVMHEWGIKNHPLSQFIDKASKLNATFIFFETADENIPLNCSRIIKLDDDAHGKVLLAEDSTSYQQFEYMPFSDEEAQMITRKMAPIYCETVSLENSLRKNISLFELLHIYSTSDLDLQERWNVSRVYDSMAAPLGVNAKNEIVYLNLHEKAHGPHGLVAGTTGSGKSEILQTFILSAATLFHPYEISFMIIDFKGGGMVNQFKELPHLIGAITNIDGREIERSLKSIKAELLKRQTLFAEANVNHIDKYIRLYKEGKVKTALPHLVIIVDEFAELKAEQPEFMKELISAARIGRSLGVHLILATQKPSGQVNEQIWSNSKFKLCLKVQTKEDSKEVLKSPLAAEIREPGRAYLQVGNNEIFELFQSAYSGGSASIDDSGSQRGYKLQTIDMAGRRNVIFEKRVRKSAERSETELEALVRYIAKYCTDSGIEKLPGICMPPLEEKIIFEQMKEPATGVGTNVALGIYDDPDNQIQGQYCYDCMEDNMLIIGAAQTGKTTLLQTFIRAIAEQYSPEDVSIYIMDFASKALAVLSELNHIGGVVTVSEDERMKHLIRMLLKEMTKRKNLFAQMGITSYHSYREAGYRDLPHYIIIIDNFGALKELYSEYEDEVLHMLREGISVGITFIVTALQTSVLGYRYMSNFGNRIALNCNEKSEYGNIFDRCRMEPRNVSGRSLISMNKLVYECQLYLPFEGDKEIERVSKIKDFVEECNRKYRGIKAREIPEVPEMLTGLYVAEHWEADVKNSYEVCVGMDYEKVEFVTLDISRIGMLSVTGKAKSGKTNFVMCMLHEMQKRVFSAPTKVYIFDDYERQLLAAKDMGIVEKYMLGIEDLDTIMTTLESELLQRQEKAKEQGLEALKKEPLFMLIIRNAEIMTNNVSKATAELFKRLVKSGKQLKLCVILADIENQSIGFSSGEIAKYAKEVRNIMLFDDLANMKLTEVNAAQQRVFKKPIELGDGYYIEENGIRKLKTVLAEGEM
jgi:S-DNA-T family DNA segregation ATPase FtsK/SpoIIIE